MQFIAEKFDPILNLFLEENYVVTIRRVDSTDKINDFDDDFVNKIEQMKIAYQNKNFEEVTTKSNYLLQQVFKNICDKKGIFYTTSDNNNALFNKVKKELKLDFKCMKMVKVLFVENFQKIFVC